jgi:phosphotriesterase-related protein
MKTLKLILLFFCIMITISGCKKNTGRIIMTVRGPVSSETAGISLTHEHILVDFIGADSISETRWDRSLVAARVLPFIGQIKDLGCRTIFECTPAYLGRDPLLLTRLSVASGLNFVTNTGYYGASDNKYIPQHAFIESAGQLAARWTKEWESGIDDTGVKPGFIKIGIEKNHLSELHRKLVVAAARTHLKTGMTIASHTGSAVAAFEQLEILKDEGVAPDAFVWVHAQSEKNIENHIRAARMGTWISLDGLNNSNVNDYVLMIKNLKDNGILDRVLLSHDAGWYRPGEVNGGYYRGYTTLFEMLIPALEKAGFSAKEINQLIVINPSKSFEIKVRNLK